MKFWRVLPLLVAPLLFLAVTIPKGPISCPDTNGDDWVGVGDIVFVVQRYMQPGTTADVNLDGWVTVADLITVVNMYGIVCD